MPEGCENWLGLINRRSYYARQTREIYCLEVHWERQYLMQLVLFGIFELFSLIFDTVTA